jgi:hypothetical protein
MAVSSPRRRVESIVPVAYPARRARASRRGVLRRLAVTLGISAVLLSGMLGSALGEAEEREGAALAMEGETQDADWMIWLEDVGFCPMMDCDSPQPGTNVIAGRLAGVTISGSLSATMIRRYVRFQRNRIRGCYERRLQSNPRLAGRVTLRFVVDHSGAVPAAHVVHSTLGDAEVEACLVDAIGEIQFPRSECRARALVSYPFVFRRAEAPRVPRR